MEGKEKENENSVPQAEDTSKLGLKKKITSSQRFRNPYPKEVLMK